MWPKCFIRAFPIASDASLTGTGLRCLDCGSRGLRASLGVLVCLAVGCGVLEPRSVIELPEENLSLDPRDLRIGPFAYPCLDWPEGRRPDADWLVVDIFWWFVNGGIEQPNDVAVDRPVMADRRRIEKAGGVILKTFNLAGVRAWFPTDSIPTIQAEPRVPIVRHVVDLRRYDVDVFIRYRRDDQWPQDSVEIAKLGGRIVIPMQLPGPASAVASMPNRSLPTLRRNPNVAEVVHSGGFSSCLGEPVSTPNRGTQGQ